jgi:formiminotetrahydrofolate cyclodeaminase
MQMKLLTVALLLALLPLSVAQAQEETQKQDQMQEEELVEQLEQAQGQPIDTLKQAVDALELRNDLLEVLLSKNELTEGDMAIIQQLTETMENALTKIDEELGIMREHVQEVRSGADAREQERIHENGQEYLERIKTLMQ